MEKIKSSIICIGVFAGIFVFIYILVSLSPDASGTSEEFVFDDNEASVCEEAGYIDEADIDDYVLSHKDYFLRLVR